MIITLYNSIKNHIYLKVECDELLAIEDSISIGTSLFCDGLIVKDYLIKLKKDVDEDIALLFEQGVNEEFINDLTNKLKEARV